MSVSFTNSLGQFSNFHNAQKFLNDQGLLNFAGFRNSWKKEIYWSIIINNKHSVGVNAMFFRKMLTLIISARYLVRQQQLKIESWKDLITQKSCILCIIFKSISTYTIIVHACLLWKSIMRKNNENAKSRGRELMQRSVYSIPYFH